MTSLNDDDPEFEALVRQILENPETLEDPSISEEHLERLHKRLNPYSVVGGPPRGGEKVTAVAACQTNLREDWLRRFTMTSLTSFLFQLLHEWRVPDAQCRWLPASVKKKEQPPAISPDELVAKLKMALEIAELAAGAAKEAAVATERHRDASFILEDKKALEALEAEAKACADKVAGCQYAAFYTASTIGGEARERLHSLAEICRQHPKSAAVLRGRKPPEPPGLIVVPQALMKTAIYEFLKNWLTFDASVHVRSSAYDAEACAKEAAEAARAAVAATHKAAAAAKGAEAKKAEAGVAAAEVKETAEAAAAEAEAAAAEAKVAAEAAAAEAEAAAASPFGEDMLSLYRTRGAPRRPAAEHAEALRVIEQSEEGRRGAARLLRDPEYAAAVEVALAAPDAFKHYLNPVPLGHSARRALDLPPPQDTFHRWAYYTEVNYDRLRSVVEALYADRPDLEWAIAPQAVFEGTRAEVSEAFDAHCQRYQDDTPSSIKLIEVGAWTLLADFKENRKNMKIYNKGTEVLEQIIRRHAEDKRIGEELMKNRVYQEKAKNIREEGPDAPGLAKWRQTAAANRKGAGASGAQRVITPGKMKALERAHGDVKLAREFELLEELEENVRALEEAERKGPLRPDEVDRLRQARADLVRAREMASVPDGAIQIDVFQSNPTTGTFTKGHIYTKAVAPPDQKEIEAAEAQVAAEAAASTFAPYAMEHLQRLLATPSAGMEPAPAEPRAEG